MFVVCFGFVLLASLISEAKGKVFSVNAREYFCSSDACFVINCSKRMYKSFQQPWGLECLNSAEGVQKRLNEYILATIGIIYWPGNILHRSWMLTAVACFTENDLCSRKEHLISPKKCLKWIKIFVTCLGTKQGILKVETVKLLKPKAVELLAMYVANFPG